MELKSAKPTLVILCAHAALLLVASTRFSALSWIWAESAWTWDYFRYAHQSGWGYQYQSDYSSAVVLTYLAAFSTGIVGYVMAGKRIVGTLRIPAMMLCVLGLISFLIEGSHWLWDHHVSWIAVCPAAGLLLAGVAALQLGMPAEPPAPPKGGRAMHSSDSGACDGCDR